MPEEYHIPPSTPGMGDLRRLPPPRPRVDIPVSDQVMDRRAKLLGHVNGSISNVNTNLSPLVYQEIAASSTDATDNFDLIEAAIKIGVQLARSGEPYRVLVAISMKLEEYVGEFKHFEHTQEAEESVKKSIQISAFVLAHACVLKAFVRAFTEGNEQWQVNV